MIVISVQQDVEANCSRLWAPLVDPAVTQQFVMSKASPVTAYCNIEVDPKAGRCIAVAQHAEACGNISIKHAAYAQGAALGDRCCMYNLAASLCNPGPCQDLQTGAACYLFFLHQSKHCPCTSIGMVLAAVENLAMMLRNLDAEGGIPQITQLPFDAFEIMRSVAKGAKERGKKEGKKMYKCELLPKRYL